MDRYNIAVRLLTWAKEHPWEWAVICGFEEADLEEQMEIAQTMEDAGFYELGLMMTVRIIRMRLTEGGDG